MNIHRTMTLIELSAEEEDTGTVSILWTGSHDEYERTFKNNKSTITKWLKDQGLIE
jgi:mRNA interferase HigB